MNQPLTIRAATDTEIPALRDVRYATETNTWPLAAPRPETPTDLSYVRRTGALWVAERGGERLGFAGTVTRSGVTFLTDLFVRPDVQSGGLGAALLQHALAAAPGAHRFTVSSSDPRAHRLYTLAGMLPRFPNYLLHTAPDQPQLAPTTLRTVAVAPDHPDLTELDAILSGRRRPEDLRYLGTPPRGQALLLLRSDTPVGYAICQAEPQAVRLGPVGALIAADAIDVVQTAISWAQQQASTVHIDLPGPHPALAPLLRAGLRIGDTDTVMASDAPVFDPVRYCGSGGTLF